MSSLVFSDGTLDFSESYGTLALGGNFEKFPEYEGYEARCDCGLGDTATNAQQDACSDICAGLDGCHRESYAPKECTFQLGMGYTNLGGKDLRFTAMQSLVEGCSVTLFKDGNGVNITCDTSDIFEKAIQSQSFQYVIDPSLHDSSGGGGDSSGGGGDSSGGGGDSSGGGGGAVSNFSSNFVDSTGTR